MEINTRCSWFIEPFRRVPGMISPLIFLNHREKQDHYINDTLPLNFNLARLGSDTSNYQNQELHKWGVFSLQD